MVPAPSSMSALVAAARRGDRRAFEDLVRATTADTYTLALRLTGNDDDARDVVQEAYLRAFRGLRRFRGDAQFATWMYRITANCAATHLARRSRNRAEPLSDETPVADQRPEHDPEHRAAAAEERVMVAAALATLPWRLRQVVVLRDIYDLAHRDIAAELGISEAAAKVRLHRARRQLRATLEGGGGAGAGLTAGGDPRGGDSRGTVPRGTGTAVRDTESRVAGSEEREAHAG